MRIKSDDVKDHEIIVAKIAGVIKYGKKHKDSTDKDAGFKFSKILDTAITIAEAGR